MKAVIYCRVSTKEQTQNLSLPTQRKASIEYCRNHGYEVDRIFIDEGESAKTSNRPEFLKLLAYCRQSKGGIYAVVVYSLNRFCRNTNDHLALRGVLSGYQAAFSHRTHG